MVEYGEWTMKGATLSDATALNEYGVDKNFIVQGIQAGKLEYRESAMWGNPCIRILRSQLERFITEKLGSDYLTSKITQTELRKIDKEILGLQKKLKQLQVRKEEIKKSGVLQQNT